MKTFVILFVPIALLALVYLIRWIKARRIANKPVKERNLSLYDGSNETLPQ